MPDNDQRLQVILSVVLARVSSPAVILVTAATARDDSSLLSRGLTTAATVAGFSVTLMSLEDFSDLPLPGGRVVQKDVDLSITENAARYDVVIVHAPSLLDTQFAVRVAQAAAGTVLALASGRKITPEDERAAELLRLVDAKFLGVVTTPPRPVAVKAVRKKAPRSEPSAAAARVKSSAP